MDNKLANAIGFKGAKTGLTATWQWVPEFEGDEEAAMGRPDMPTRTEKGTLPVNTLLQLPGARAEHRLFEQSPSGKMTPAKWDRFVEDIREHGIIQPIFIVVEWTEHLRPAQADALKGETFPVVQAFIYEGNHRVQAAAKAGLQNIPVEVKYFGLAEQSWRWPGISPSSSPLQSLPVVQKPMVWHVGRGPHQPRQRGISSYEGTGLSVSTHPRAWIRIARLGDLPTWELRRHDGQPGRFVSMHDLTDSQHKVLWAEAMQQGLVIPGFEYVLSWWDDEWKQEMSTPFASRQDAEDEAEDIKGHRIEKRSSYLPTETLITLWQRHFPSSDPDNDFAWLTVLERTGGYDGVWWEDVLDPLRLTAPHGVIFQATLPAWSWVAPPS